MVANSVETALEIKPYVSFSPFENGEGRIHKDEETDCPTLLVPKKYPIVEYRRKISWQGVTGFIDIIHENPDVWVSLLLEGKKPQVPFGDFGIKETGKEEWDTITEAEVKKAWILSSIFHIQTPYDYEKLLNSYANVLMGQTNYHMGWNLSEAIVERNKKTINYQATKEDDERETLLLCEVDLCTPEDLVLLDPRRARRFTYVWIPPYHTIPPQIELTFYENQA